MLNLKLSVITPNFNYSPYISQLCESIISQNFENVEHIIIDDGSTDNSVEVIREFIARYPNIFTLIQQKNSGQTVALNTAMRNVSGDIIGWINSDDFYCENIFKKVVSIFEENSKVDAVFGNFNVVDINGNFIYMKRHFKFNPVESAFLGFGNTLTSNCIFWKKSLSDKISPFDERLKCNMDGEFFSRLTCKAKLYFLDIPIANFRKQEISIAGKNNTEWNKIVRQEILLEKTLSYNRLYISRFIPYRLGKHIKYFYLLKRFIQKVLRSDYYTIYKSKKIYRSRSLNLEA